MTTEQKTHWRSVAPSPYFAAVDLDGKDMVVTIECVRVGDVAGEKGRVDQCRVATISRDGKILEKELLLNVTNSKAMSKLTGSNYLDDWTKQRVTLYVTQTKHKGEMVDAIRIRLTRPPEPIVVVFTAEQKAEAKRLAEEILALNGQEKLAALRKEMAGKSGSETIDALNELKAKCG